MGKQNKKSALLAVKKRHHDVKINPFEVRINRKKREVLGQRRDRSERGLPGVSRSRAIEKRKKTLLREYKERDKRNSVIDRRFGERDDTLSHDDKMTQRYILERKRHHEKSSIYNIEEESLTHYGQSLGDMERFDELQLSSDDDEQVDDTETHFGGFLRKTKRISNEKEEDDKGLKKTRKQVIEELITKSKLHKRERQLERDKIGELLDVVDNQWKEMKSLINKPLTIVPDTNERGVVQSDIYDQYVQELATQPRRAMACDRMKTEEELAKDEKNRLEKLEHQRLERMSRLSDTINNGDNNNISGDYDVKSDTVVKKDPRLMLHYKDGKVVLPPGVTSLVNSNHEKEEPKNEEEEEEEENDDEEEEEENDEEKEENDEEKEDEENDEEKEDEENDEEKEDEENDEEKEEVEEAQEEEDEDGEKNVCEGDGEEMESEDEVEIMKNNLSDDVTQDELPYIYEDVPSSIDQLVTLFKDRSPIQCGIIIDRIYSCHHPSLSNDNKIKIEMLFDVLINYCLKLSSSLTLETMNIIDKLSRPLFKLSQVSSNHTAKCFQKLLKQCLKRYQKLKKEQQHRFPHNKDLIIFKLVGLFFPTSDYRHPVTTPTLHLMTLALSKSTVQSIRDICNGLYVCQVLIEYITLSKRYIPELINYLTSVISCYITDKDEGPLYPPFTNKTRKLLHQLCNITSSQCHDDQSLMSLLELVCYNTSKDMEYDDEILRISVINVAIKQVIQVSSSWQHLSSYDAIFSPIYNVLKCLNETSFPLVTQTVVTDLLNSIETGMKIPKPILQILRQKPKSIKFFEPLFDNDYQPGKRKSHNRTIAERMKLKYKHKREMKGAIREIRKDSKFLAREKLKEKLERDAERKRRVKQIEGWLQEERHDAKIERIKKNK